MSGTSYHRTEKQENTLINTIKTTHYMETLMQGGITSGILYKTG